MPGAGENWQNRLRLWLGDRLEQGRGLPLAHDPDPVRTVALPAAAVIGVGGALLGGSGRTPLALAVAEHYAGRAPLAFVSHGYGGQAARPVRVDAQHGVREVGDEAVLAFRRLAPLGVPVWSGPREATLHAAQRDGARILVVDGLLQTRPKRLALALLALSGPAPWGSGAVWPRGDLRARPARLQAAADRTVTLSEQMPLTLEGGWAKTSLEIPHAAPRARDCALLLGEARAERFQQALARAGLQFKKTVRFPDHRAHTLDVQRDLGGVAGVFVSEKTSAALPAELPVPMIIVRLRVELPGALCAQLDSLLP